MLERVNVSLTVGHLPPCPVTMSKEQGQKEKGGGEGGKGEEKGGGQKKEKKKRGGGRG